MTEFDASKIKVIFMDIGGVLLTNGWDYNSREKASEIFNFDFKEMNILHNFIYNVFEIGSVSFDQYLNTVLFHTPPVILQKRSLRNLSFLSPQNCRICWSGSKNGKNKPTFPYLQSVTKI